MTAITYSSVPPDPSNLTAVTSSNDVILTVADNSNNEDGFWIERGTNMGNLAFLATTTRNLTASMTYTDVGAGTSIYYYRVRAYNVLGDSGYSNPATDADVITVSGAISADTTWDSSHIYKVTNATISSDVTLTINAGTVVKFTSNSSGITVQGTLSAQGSAGSLIYFTSLKDDSVGGNTDGVSDTPAQKDWNTIDIESNGTANITNAVVRYGGDNNSGHYGAEFYVNGGSLTMASSTVATSTYGIYSATGTTSIATSDISSNTTNGKGIWIDGGTVSVTSSNIHDNKYGVYNLEDYGMGGPHITISGSHIYNNGFYGVAVSGAGSLDLTGNTFTDNATMAVKVDLSIGLTFTHSGNTASGSGFGGFGISGIMINNQTWTGGDLPYIPSGFTVSSVATLTIDSGTVVKFKAQNASSYIYVSGTLNAKGTAESPIYFTSINDDDADGLDTNGSSTSPVAGDWDTIEVDSGGTANLAHTVVRYGGYTGGGGTGAELYNYGGTLDLSDSEVATSKTYGIYQQSGASTITSSNIHDVTGASTYGIYAADGSLDLEDSTFSNNTTDIHTEPGVTYTHDGNTFSNGCPEAGICKGGTISSDTTWVASSTPYVVTSTLTVAGGATLTINAGAIVKFSTTTSNIVVEGALNAAGSATGTIYFTSLKDDTVGGDTNGDNGATSATSGDWDGIVIHTGTSSIAYATLRYGGHSSGAVYNYDGSLTIASSTIATSTNYGIAQAGTNAVSTVIASEIHHIKSGYGYGVYVYDGTMDIHASAIHDNAYGVVDNSGTLTIYGSDIHDNGYGVYIAAGTASVTDNAFSFNTSYGLYTEVAGIDATYNFWNHYNGPSPEGDGDSVGGSITHNDYYPWHAVNNVLVNSSVHDGMIRWAGSTPSYEDEWSYATSVWAMENDGNEVRILSATTSPADVTLQEWNHDDGERLGYYSQYKPKSVPPTTDTDMIYINSYAIDVYPGQSATGVEADCLHELGHALGLGHSHDGNVMVSNAAGGPPSERGEPVLNANGDPILGDQDKSDYHWWWTIFRWVLSF